MRTIESNDKVYWINDKKMKNRVNQQGILKMTKLSVVSIIGYLSRMILNDKKW